MQLFSFAIAIPLYRVFDYVIDKTHSPQPGLRYRLPFGSGFKTGLLLESRDESSVPIDRVKTALQCLDDHPVLSEHMLALARWMAEYYLQPIGEV